MSGVLFVVFLVLRLTDHIDWAWYWVASPLWMPLALVLTIGAMVVLVSLIVAGLVALFERAGR